MGWCRIIGIARRRTVYDDRVAREYGPWRPIVTTQASVIDQIRTPLRARAAACRLREPERESSRVVLRHERFIGCSGAEYPLHSRRDYGCASKSMTHRLEVSRDRSVLLAGILRVPVLISRRERDSSPTPDRYLQPQRIASADTHDMSAGQMHLLIAMPDGFHPHDGIEVHIGAA